MALLQQEACCNCNKPFVAKQSISPPVLGKRDYGEEESQGRKSRGTTGLTSPSRTPASDGYKMAWGREAAGGRGRAEQ